VAKSDNAKPSVQSLDRALGLLKLLSDHPNGLTLAELAPKAELANSTAHRLLTSLLQHDFVSYETATGRWYVGLTAFRVGAAFNRRSDYIAIARTSMRKLVDETGETSNLAVLRGTQLTFVSQIECDHAMRMAVPIGTKGPLHASAVGKAILAYLEPQEREKLIGSIEFKKLTDKTISSPKALQEACKKIAKAGFAIDDEEQALGLRCIAAPIFNELQEPIFAVSISGPTVRVSTKHVDELAEKVKAAALQITEQIGGVPR
jgi:IclR family acetate operon transcriptional repressor